MELELYDLNTGLPLYNHSQLFLRICIYSSENPPIEIKFNTAGNKIIKGDDYIEVKDGKARFNKLQIKEVSSHFRNGWIFLVVLPKAKEDFCDLPTSNDGDNNTLNIEPEDIKPLIFENVKVKAKLKTYSKKKSSKLERSEKNDQSKRSESLPQSKSIIEEIRNLREQNGYKCEDNC